jgi:hypothetical protein
MLFSCAIQGAVSSKLFQVLRGSDDGVQRLELQGSGLCPSSGILSTRRERLGKWISFRPQVEWKAAPTLLGPLERAHLSQPAINVDSF